MNDLLVFGVFAGLAAVVVLAAILHARRKRRRDRQRLSTLAADLEAETVASGGHYRAELDGRTYDFAYSEGSRNSPSHLIVRVDCPSPGSFRLRPENGFDRVFKRLGIAVEIQTGDREFDAATYVSTDEVPFTQRFLAASEKRRAVLELIERGFREISHDGRTMQAKCAPFALEPGSNRPVIEDAVRRLASLCEAMPEDTYEGRLGGTSAWKWRRRFALGVASASAVIGIGLMLWGSHAYPPLDAGDLLRLSLRYSVPALLGFLVLSVVLLKGRSSSHRDLALVLLASSVGAIVGGFGGFAVANGSLDRGAATSHDAAVLARRKTSGRSESHYVTVASWRADRDREELDVSRRLYEAAGAEGARLRVTTRPGQLGFEWIEALAVLPPDR
ncbi:MAG: hypothetical protein QNK03_24765 [Myxococcota bacterium]|nr:hypothetical protein [Myxococcota bacterium]